MQFCFLIALCLTDIQAVEIKDIYDCDTEKHAIQKLFKVRDLDFDSKSAIGWVRVLNSPDKRKEYKLDDLDNSQIIYLTARLKEISKFSRTAFEGKLR